eukprot:9376377-Pyramimonas_sp.AAC.1
MTTTKTTTTTTNDRDDDDERPRPRPRPRPPRLPRPPRPLRPHPLPLYRMGPFGRCHLGCFEGLSQISYDRHLTQHVLGALLKQPQLQVANPRTWVSCRDPVQAVTVTLERIEWQMKDMEGLVDDWGVE